MTQREKLMSRRREMLDGLEKKLLKGRKPEDSLFFYHPNEDRIVLSHAMFWVMAKKCEKVMPWNKTLLLLRRYQEEMLEAYLTESDAYPELLHNCNTIFECLPFVLSADHKDPVKGKATKKLCAISVVASGYAGDMDDKLADELLDDIDFRFNKVYCWKIELMLPLLDKMVEKELQAKSTYVG